MWSIAKGILWLLDGFFDVLDTIWRFKFFDNEYVNKVFSASIIVACSWLVLKVVIELIMNYIVKGEDRASPLSVYKGIVLAIVMMFLITPLFQFGHNVSTAMTDAVITISGMNENTDSEGTISKAIIRSMVYEDEMEADKIDELTNNWKTIDINETSGGFVGFGDCYIYSLNFFMLIILSIVCVFLFLFIAIQIAKRVMEIALYKIIGPFCCTSLTNPNGSKAFETWCKSTMGVFLVTVVQFVCIGLLMNLFGTAFSDAGFWAGIFLIIGALMFIISTPAIINTLLHQSSGMLSAYSDIQSLLATSFLVSKITKPMSSFASWGLSKGANVVKGGISKGQGGISNMLNNIQISKGQKLSSDQMSTVQDSLKNHNPRKAYTQVGDFLKQNKGQTVNPNSSSSFNQFNNMKFNPIRNEYLNRNKSNDIKDRSWY